MFLDYQVGLGKIYSISDIDKAKQSPSFEREYDLKYGVGLGNVFIPREIDICCELWRPTKVNHGCDISMGIDPGFGSSNFGITILQLEDDIIKTMYAREINRPSYEEMIRLVTQLRYQYKPIKIYVDGAKPDFIKSLKIQFNENINYEQVIKRANHDKIDYEFRMMVIPVNFNEFGKELLGRFQYVVSKKWFAVSGEEHKELVTQMRMARYKDNGNLDKESTTNNNTFDVFDSTRLALKMFEKGGKR